jgi:tetratricopeptide (TPR) repeat protein
MESKPSWLQRLFRRQPAPQVNPPPVLQTRPEAASPSPRITPNSNPAVFVLRPEDSVPAVWRVGDVLMNQYEVTSILGEGGMGTVYKIHYSAWNRDLAVKSPRSEIFVKRGGKEHFIREARTWVHLREHSHLVRCYFVETLGGIPRIFAEYVDGGSLADWIHRRKLYEGGPQRALERILDIAIQFAWGLHAAHEQGLVHQDVKPANVMVTLEGVAKVTDFGLAKARAMAGEQEVLDEKGQQSLLVSSRGMTPAYCSPEQSAGQRLSHKTDIWSWGVSVLEMFVGRVTWRLGVEARDALSRYERQDPMLPRMPASVVRLLHRCFEPQPEARPATMSEVAAELQAIYAHLLEHPYAREAPEQTELDANTLIHRGTSLRQLGQPLEALLAFEQAIGLDPASVSAYYHKGNTLQDIGQLQEALLAFEQAIGLDPDNFPAYHGKGMVLVALRRPQEALLAFEQAIRINPTSATAYNNKGNVLKDLGRSQEALFTFEEAIRLDPADASTYNNKGAALAALGRFEEALLTFEEAIRLDPTAAPIYYSKGLALHHLGRFEEALLTYEQAIGLGPTFALAHYSKGVVLQEFRRSEEALLAFEQAIRLNPTFADSYYHKAAILTDLGRLEEARKVYFQAQVLRYRG